MTGPVEVFVSKDGLEAVLHLSSSELSAAEREAALDQAIETAELKFGLDETLLEKVRDGLGDPRFWMNETVARGRAPEPGLPSRLIVAFAPFVGAGLADEYDRIDFKERLALIRAEPGQIIARSYPSTEGRPGIDVRGREIVSPCPEEDTTIFGPGVEVDADGYVRVTRAGVVAHRAGRQLDVLDIYEHPEEVGPASGNLETGGSLVVHGDVRAGFRVDAGGDLLIMGDVDRATIRARGNIEINRAIIGDDEARARAGGDFSCKRMQNALVSSGGRLAFGREVVNSTIRARSVESEDTRGVILGSSVVAMERIRVPNVGSVGGQHVLLEVGFDWAFRDRMRRLETSVVSRGRSRRGSDGRSRRSRRSGQVSDDLGRAQLELRRRNRRLLGEARIEITGTAFSGVELRFGRETLVLEEEVRNHRFRLDGETGKIIGEKLLR